METLRASFVAACILFVELWLRRARSMRLARQLDSLVWIAFDRKT